MEVVLHAGDEVAKQIHPVVRQIRGGTTGADPRVVHAQAGDGLVELQTDLTLPQTDLGDRGGTQLHRSGAHGNQV